MSGTVGRRRASLTMSGAALVAVGAVAAGALGASGDGILDTTLVTRGAAGAVADDSSRSPSTSADGRYVAFASTADNLDPDSDDSFEDVFVRDLQANTTTLVSRATGATGAVGDGTPPSPRSPPTAATSPSARTPTTSTPNPTTSERRLRPRPARPTPRLWSAVPPAAAATSATTTPATPRSRPTAAPSLSSRSPTTSTPNPTTRSPTSSSATWRRTPRRCEPRHGCRRRVGDGARLPLDLGRRPLCRLQVGRRQPRPRLRRRGARRLRPRPGGQRHDPGQPRHRGGRGGRRRRLQARLDLRRRPPCCLRVERRQPRPRLR